MHRKAKGPGFKMKRSPVKGISIQEQIFGTGEVSTDTPTTSQSLIEAAGQFVTPPSQLDLDYGGEMDIEIPVDFSTKEGEVDPERAEKKRIKKEKRKEKWKNIKKKVKDFLKGKDGDDDGGDDPGAGGGDAPGGDDDIGDDGTGDDGTGDDDTGEVGETDETDDISLEEEERNRQEAERLEEEEKKRLEEEEKKRLEEEEKERLEGEERQRLEEEEKNRQEEEKKEKDKQEKEKQEKERQEKEMSKMKPIDPLPPREITPPETTLNMEPVQPGPEPIMTDEPDILAHEDPKLNFQPKIEGRVIRTGNNTIEMEDDDGKPYTVKTTSPGYKYNPNDDEWYYTSPNGDVSHITMENVPEGHLIQLQQSQEAEYNKQRKLDKEYREVKFNPKKRREFEKNNPDYKTPKERGSKRNTEGTPKILDDRGNIVEQETETTEQTTDYSNQSLNDLSKERDKRVANNENADEIQKEINKRLEEDPNADWSEKEEIKEEAPPERNRRTDREYKNANAFQKQVMRRKNPNYPWPE